MSYYVCCMLSFETDTDNNIDQENLLDLHVLIKKLQYEKPAQ